MSDAILVQLPVLRELNCFPPFYCNKGRLIRDSLHSALRMRRLACNFGDFRLEESFQLPPKLRHLRLICCNLSSEAIYQTLMSSSSTLRHVHLIGLNLCPEERMELAHRLSDFRGYVLGLPDQGLKFQRVRRREKVVRWALALRAWRKRGRT